jgi:hypothetical protein
MIRERKYLDKYCIKFYSKLYEQGDMSKETIRTRYKMLDVMTIRFTNKMNKELEQPIIEKELKEVIEEMTTRKAPRLDGIAFGKNL